tara:strand:+ start:268 stop:462 length:195 start_codon:yes stop_codon:yes gene_type:complete
MEKEKKKRFLITLSKMYKKMKVKVDNYEYDSLAEDINNDKVPAENIALYFSDKTFYKYFKEKYL